jgi:hypothetical protein
LLTASLQSLKPSILSIMGGVMEFRTLDRPCLTLLFAIILCVTAGGRAVSAAPSAPSPVSPVDGATVTEPFTISWTAVSDPSGIVGYNWQVSASSTFTSVLLQNSTSGATQASVSGLANGTYFWRVQGANGAFEQGAWSQPRSFTVTGAGTGSPGTPSLAPPKGYSTFHPLEVMTFTWSAIPEAANYLLQYSTDPSFPVSSTGEFDNIPDPTYSFAIANPEGNYFARVFALDSSGIFSAPSNVISFSVFYSNPVPPPPAIVSPVNNPTLTLPVTLTWEHVVNPQPSGYEIQIARDSGFQTLEVDDPQLNGPTREILSLTPGTKFWRVRSAQGDASPTTAAETAWSAVGTFTISSAPPTPVSVTLAKNPLYSGETTSIAVQLTAAVPTGGATINMSSSNPGALSVPATITMPGNIAWTQFQVQAGQVSVATPVTITATLNSASASAEFTLQPTSLNWIVISPATISGGAQPQGIVLLKGQAPAGGAVVSLSSNSPMVSPPTSVTIEPGGSSASFPIPTSPVTANTTATVTASYNGVAAQAQVTLTPQQPPTSLTLNPTTTSGTSGSFALVTVASTSSTDEVLQVASSNPSIASVPSGVTIPAGSTTGGFNISTTAVSTQTVVTISVSGGGVTKTASLTINPAAPATPTAPALLSPASNAKVPQPINFDWSDVSGATSYELQIDDSSNFTAPLTLSQTVGVSQATVTGLPTQRFFWRVRAFNSAGVAGPFSASRRFEAQAGSTSTATLSAVNVSPTSVAGGVTAQGTIALTGGAPSGGAVVTLSSANPSIVSVPSSVLVAAGASSATFGVNTSAVTANTAVTITATYAGVSRTTTLTVTPASTTTASLSAVSVSPTSVVGGTTAQGTITLTGGAPSGGAVVTLTSANTSVVSVPTSVVVPAGSSNATFGVNTSAVTANTGVTITATYAGISRTTTLTVTPASTGALPAPSLLSPAADARFSPGTNITFDWTDVSGAASYTIQIDDSDTFAAPLVSQNTTVSQFTTNTLPTIRMWFRVRANSASGTPGNWSSARRFEVKN